MHEWLHGAGCRVHECCQRLGSAPVAQGHLGQHGRTGDVGRVMWGNKMKVNKGAAMCSGLLGQAARATASSPAHAAAGSGDQAARARTGGAGPSLGALAGSCRRQLVWEKMGWKIMGGFAGVGRGCVTNPRRIEGQQGAREARADKLELLMGASTGLLYMEL